MATDISDLLGRKSDDRNDLSYPIVLDRLLTIQSRSNTKISRPTHSRPPSPTKGIRKLTKSCMTWCHKVSLLCKPSQRTPPLMCVNKENDKNDGNNEGHLPTSMSTSYFSNTSWDCISTITDEIECSEQLSKREHCHCHDSDPDPNYRMPQHASHLLDSVESLSLQTIYDGEVFGGDVGSWDLGEQTDTDKRLL